MKRILFSILALIVLGLHAQEPKIPPCEPVRIAIIQGTNYIVIRAWLNQSMCCGIHTLYLERNTCSCTGGWARIATNSLYLCTDPSTVFIQPNVLPFALYRVVRQ